MDLTYLGKTIEKKIILFEAREKLEYWNKERLEYTESNCNQNQPVNSYFHCQDLR